MKKFLQLLLLWGALCQGQGTVIKDTHNGVLLKFSANPDSGFNYDYLLYLPAKLQKGNPAVIMVETNNGGANDSLDFQERAAINTASESGVANYVAEKIGLPLLVPIFPRPESQWQLYTHALDRDSFLTDDAMMKRLDLQLLSMIEDAKKQLGKMGYEPREKYFLAGFSASGTFANRFSMLHPEKIQATASGGINAIAILPVKKLSGSTLNYPLGIADIATITGHKPNVAAFAKMPKLLYMGGKDDNDAAAFDDAYSDEERRIIYDLFGKPMDERWASIEKIYRENGIKAEFRTYPDIGHGTDLKINDDLTMFFTKHLY